MKKFVLSLIACFAIVQSTYAATPPLTESLLEYEAIISAIGDPSFDTIPTTEFIIDIKRISKRIDNLGEVKYKIVTVSLNEGSDFPRIKYIATLHVFQNPGVGPNIVTVDSIVRVTPVENL